MPTYNLPCAIQVRKRMDGGGTLLTAQRALGTVTGTSTTGDRRVSGKINGDQIEQEFFEYDLSGVAAGVVTDAYVTLDEALGGGGSDFIVHWFVFDFGGAVDDADVRSSTWAATATEAGSSDTATWPGFGGGPFVVPIDPAVITPGGVLRMVAMSSHQVLEQNPSGSHHYREIEDNARTLTVVVDDAPPPDPDPPSPNPPGVQRYPTSWNPDFHAFPDARAVADELRAAVRQVGGRTQVRSGL